MSVGYHYSVDIVSVRYRIVPGNCRCCIDIPLVKCHCGVIVTSVWCRCSVDGADSYMFSFANRLSVKKMNFLDIYINWSLIIIDKLIYDKLSIFYVCVCSSTLHSIKQMEIVKETTKLISSTHLQDDDLLFEHLFFRLVFFLLKVISFLFQLKMNNNRYFKSDNGLAYKWWFGSWRNDWIEGQNGDSLLTGGFGHLT